MSVFGTDTRRFRGDKRYKGVIEVMINQICRHIRNFFIRSVSEGEFGIVGGELYPSASMQDGDFYLISGSKYNDGVHIHPAYDLKDEEFVGEVSVMKPPMDFLNVVMEIEEYCRSGCDKASPYLKESFGGYSYTRLTDGGTGSSWQKVFKTKLNPWRKI